MRTKTESILRWVETPSGCRLATRTRVLIDGKRVTTRVALYEDVYGPVPSGRVLRQTCNTEGCVRPDHQLPVSAGEAREARLQRTLFRSAPLVDVRDDAARRSRVPTVVKPGVANEAARHMKCPECGDSYDGRTGRRYCSTPCEASALLERLASSAGNGARE